MNPTAQHEAPAPPGPAIAPRSRLRAVRGICIGVAGIAVLEFVIATTGDQLHHLPASTDFATYYLAGAQAHAGFSPYDRDAIVARGHAIGFAHDQNAFLYPPPFALAMQPFGHLSYPRARQVWLVLCTAALLAALAWTAALVLRLAGRHGVENRDAVWIMLAAFFCAGLNSTSVHNDVRAGSVGILLYLALVAAAWGMLERRAVTTGAALAGAALLKLAPIALIPWVAWRNGRRAAAVGLALLGLAMIPALGRWGGGIVPDYIQNVILPIVRGDFPFPMNQSLDAMLSRLLVPNEYVQTAADLPGLKRLLAAALGLGIVITTCATLRRRPRHPTLLPVEMGYVVLAMLMIMKITWLHTLCTVLFLWPCLMVAILRAAERSRPWARSAALWASAGFFLSSAHIPVLWTALRHGPAVGLISIHLLGLVILWLVSRTVLRHEPDCV
jgi:hypothetical protein